MAQLVSYTVMVQHFTMVPAGYWELVQLNVLYYTTNNSCGAINVTATPTGLNSYLPKQVDLMHTTTNIQLLQWALFRVHSTSQNAVNS